MIPGTLIAIIEVVIYLAISFEIRRVSKKLRLFNALSYYWLTFTILTMFWEISFISNYKNVSKIATALLKTNEHVWTKTYNLTYILPWRLAYIFYAEYGAYADREYMTLINDWSRIIEGTHAIFCGLFSLITLILLKKNRKGASLVTMCACMGAQLMNSILYITNYVIETQNANNINYDIKTFPSGFLFIDRPFMYINIFWTVMPIYVISMAFIKNYRLVGPLQNFYL